MSSSTTAIARNNITESWIHMQQNHGFINNNNEKKETQQQQQEGKYARSTASSRSRGETSNLGIHEVFAEADRLSEKKPNTTATKIYNDTRRKSTTTIEGGNKSRLLGTTTTSNQNSPRLRSTNTTTVTATAATKAASNKLNIGRRQTLSGALMTTNNATTTTKNSNSKTTANSESSSGPGLIKLADTLRDTLANEKRIAKQELLNKARASTGGQQQQQQQSVVDIISSAKRRSSMTKEKLRTLDQQQQQGTTTTTTKTQTARRRTLSSGAAMLQAQQPAQEKQASYMKSTLAADQQRRHSTLTMITPRNSTSTSPPIRRKSTMMTTSTASPVHSEDEQHRKTPNAALLKRRSILAAATAKARQQLDNTTNRSHSSSGDEKSTPTTTVVPTSTRTRKKSIVNNSTSNKEEIDTSLLANRRMSRTESLKEGLPTSPSMMAARMARRKSVIKQDSPPNNTINKRSSVNENDAAPKATTPTKKIVPTVRKRGKTLPGSLAKPPTVQSLQLPPMKVEPIRLNIPAHPRTPKRGMTPKSPNIKATTTSTNRLSTQRKRMSLCSNTSTSTTPIPVSSSSSSSAEGNTASIVTPPKKSLSTRRQKGQSRLGIMSSRRASLKITTTSNNNNHATQIVTPPLKSAAGNAAAAAANASASPRVRPRSTRRQSLANLENKSSPSLVVTATSNNHVEQQQQQQQEGFYGGSRKLSSSAYSSSSRKNSLVEESSVDKDKGRHRAISLREKLEAMVAQHAINEDNLTTPTTPTLSAAEYSPHRQRKKSIGGYELTGATEEKYTQLLTAEERARPQRIKDTLMMWDKEMVEAFSPGVPKSPQIAIKFYGHHLSPFEQTEIQSYPEVYFVGHHAKKHQAMPDNAALNYGYDDERGDYKSVMNDHLGYRYEILEELGRGSFGQVVKCYDHKTASTVAVKLIRNKKRFYAQAKTEVKILSDLVKWDPEDRHHNVKMTDSFYFRNHLCIACECLSMNLYEFIKINNFQGFHITLIKRFTVQLLRSLSLLSRHGVVHCDLKPENILLKHPTKSTIKVIDFGSSCLENQRVYTYIQSRFYRSPEIILGLDYTMAIDMWSLGCIIAELYTGVPIFPGENEQEQLACIMEVLGVPDPQLIQMSERRNLFFDRRGEPRVVCNSRGKKRRAGTKNLAQALRCNDPLFLDFIKQCLEWDPAKRLNPERAFQHEWILQSTRPTATIKTSSSPTEAAEGEGVGQEGHSPKPTSTLNDTTTYA